MTALLQKLMIGPVSRPRTTLLLAALVSLLALVGAMRLRVDASLDAMFPQHDPAAQAMMRLLGRFSTADELLLLVTLPDDAPPDPDKLIAFAGRFEKAVEQSPDASNLTAGIIYRAEADDRRFIEQQLVPSGMFYLSDAEFAAARQRLTLPAMKDKLAQDQSLLSEPGPAADALAKALMQDPLGLHDLLLPKLQKLNIFRTWQSSDALVSQDGRALLIRVLGKHPVNDLDYSLKLFDGMSRVAATAGDPGVGISFGGSYAIAAASARSIRHDALVSVNGSIALLLGLFIIFYRRPIRLFTLAFIPVAIGTFWGFGCFGWLSGTFSPIAAVIGGVLAGMGIDYSVLFLTQYESLKHDLAPAKAARQTMQDIGPAVFAAWITSVAGFVATGASSVKALRDFSFVGTLGLTGCFIAATCALPAALALLDKPASQKGGPRLSLAPILTWLARFPRLFMVTGGIVLIIAGVIAVAPRGPLLQPEPDLRKMHPSPNPALETQAQIARRFGSSEFLLIDLRATTQDELIAMAHEISRRLSQSALTGVAGVYGIDTWLPEASTVRQRTAKLSEADADQISRDFTTAVEQSDFNPASLAPYGQFLSRLLSQRRAPCVADLRNYPSLARSLLPIDASSDGTAPEAVTIVFLSHPSEDRSARDEAIGAVNGALTGMPGGWVLTGLPVVSHDAEAAVFDELPRLLGIAAALVAGYLLLHFRSLSRMAMALLPAVFGFAGLAAFIRLSSIRLNMINLVALPLLLGITVDYGIYLVSLAKANRAAQVLSRGAMAVLVCALSMVVGYASLLTTSIPAVGSLGIVVSVGVGCSLAAALLVLCPWLIGRRDNQA